MKVEIEVTHHDIDNAERDNCFECPAALAIGRYLRSGYVVGAHYSHIEIADSGLYMIEVPTPDGLRERMGDFDHGRPIEPFAFPLDLPQNILSIKRCLKCGLLRWPEEFGIRVCTKCEER